MASAPGSRFRRALAYYGAHAAVSLAVVAAVERYQGGRSLASWLYGGGDGMFFTALAQAVHEDGLWHATRIGAPFGADIVDWPLGMWLPFAMMSVFMRIFHEPVTAITLYWISSIVMAGTGAAFAFRRLRIPVGLAFVLGHLYAFLPYAFYRNIGHINLAYPLVPLLGLLCLRVAGMRPDEQGRSERIVLRIACALQGFVYVYYTFFAGVFLVPALALGWLRTRRGDLLRQGVVALLLLGAGTAITLAPSLWYWRKHGPNRDLDYKSAAQTDEFGLKLRHLVTPIRNHPLPLLATIAERLEESHFPIENENRTARLGSVGTIGLGVLLMFLLGRASGAWPNADEDLGPAAALTLVGLLVAQVGGLASLFSVFVSPDIRAYNRIVVFLAFFCLFASGVVLARAAERWRRVVRSRALALAALAVLLIAGLLDQMPLAAGAAIAPERTPFFQDRAFVQGIERQLPAGAMVFQLPHTTIPVDLGGHPPMGLYEGARGFLHSRTLRWSWGSVLGRGNGWQEMASRLPTEEMVRTLALAGFSGIWVDRFGYSGKGALGADEMRYPELEAQLAAAVGRPLEVSPDGRVSFVSLLAYTKRLESVLGSERREALRDQMLRSVSAVRWISGCEPEQLIDGGRWHPCGSESVLWVRNTEHTGMAVLLTGAFRSGDGARRRVAVSFAGQKETLELGKAAVTWQRNLYLEGRMKWPLKLVVEDGPACDAAACLAVDMTAFVVPPAAAAGG